MGTGTYGLGRGNQNDDTNISETQILQRRAVSEIRRLDFFKKSSEQHG